jgi:hypothetical protein
MVKRIVLFITHYFFASLKKMEKHRIDGTQIPTNIPSSLKSLNQSVTDNRKLKKAKRAG